MKIALKRIVTIIKWISLMVFAYYFLKYLAPIAFVIGIYKIFWKSKVGKGLDDLAVDLRNVNLCLDELGCVTVFKWLDFSNDGRAKYGIPGEKISYVLYLREKQNKLTFLDRLIFKLIDGLDKGHFEVFEPKEVILKHLK